MANKNTRFILPSCLQILTNLSSSLVSRIVQVTPGTLKLFLNNLPENMYSSAVLGWYNPHPLLSIGKKREDLWSTPLRYATVYSGLSAMRQVSTLHLNFAYLQPLSAAIDESTQSNMEYTVEKCSRAFNRFIDKQANLESLMLTLPRNSYFIETCYWDGLHNLTALTYLYAMMFGRLELVGRSMGKLLSQSTGLRELELRYVRFQDNMTHYEPLQQHAPMRKALKNLSHLTRLVLIGCGHQVLDHERNTRYTHPRVLPASMRHLDLSESHIDNVSVYSLVDVLSSVPYLTYLSLANTGIVEAYCFRLKYALTTLTRLKVLDLHEDLAQREMGDRNAEALHQSLASLNSLECLNLERLNCTSSQSHRVYSTFTGLTALTGLTVSCHVYRGISFEPAQLEHLCSALPSLHLLKDFVLDVRLSANCCVILAPELSHLAALTHVTLDTPSPDCETFCRVLGALEHLTNLQSLALGLNESALNKNESSTAVENLFSAIGGNLSHLELHFVSTRTAQTPAPLKSQLPQLRNLSALSLIFYETCAWVFDLLACFDTLVSLEHLRVVGGELTNTLLVPQIPYLFPNLVSLDITRCKVEMEPWCASALQLNMLRRLNLARTVDFTEQDCLTHVAKLVASHSVLQELFICSLSADVRTVQPVVDAARESATLTLLDLSGQEDGIEAYRGKKSKEKLATLRSLPFVNMRLQGLWDLNLKKSGCNWRGRTDWNTSL